MSTHYTAGGVPLAFTQEDFLVYLCFQLYYLIDHHCKTYSELIGIIENNVEMDVLLSGCLETMKGRFMRVS